MPRRPRQSADPARGLRPEAVAACYDESAEGYDERHGDRRSAQRFRVIEAPLRRLCGPGRRVLELGCGTGRFLRDAPGRGVGVDVSLGMLRRARERGLAVAAGDAQQLPFGSGKFDVVVAPKGVVRYLDYGRAFSECARVLAPGGWLGVHQYAARTWSPRRFWRVPEADSELHVERVEELTGPAGEVGLEAVETYFFRSVRVVPFAIRLPRWVPGALWSHVVVVFRRVG